MRWGRLAEAESDSCSLRGGRDIGGSESALGDCIVAVSEGVKPYIKAKDTTRTVYE